MHVFATALMTLVTLAAVHASQGRRVPKGFVTINGTQFELDGKPYAFVGANSYWLPLLTTQKDIETTFEGMEKAGIKVLRTWGHNAINGTELADAKKTNLTYYQVWNGSRWQLNDGPQGLERLDKVIETAGKYGVKVILTFTNNWVGYGGAELYLNWILGGHVTHDEFYTNKKVVASYQKYVKSIVNRYKNSPNIFAWELINEARCSGDLPSSPKCPGSATLTNWFKKQSAYVRSLDPYHMISTGGEGQFNQKNPVHYWYNNSYVSDYNFNGQAGEDFDNDLMLPNIDFGVYHAYPQPWYGNIDHPGSNFSIKDWGVSWIDWHVKSAKRANKPLVFEEFGVTGYENKTSIYPAWVQHALDTKHGGIMPWQFGQLDLLENGGNRVIKYSDAIIQGASPNDGYTYYPNQTEVWSIFTRAANIQNSRSK